MKTRVALMAAVVGGVASLATAQLQPQTQGTVTWNLQYFVATQGPAGWSNATVAAAPGGVVGQDQAALFKLSFTLSGTPGGWDAINEVVLGSPLTWASTIQAGSTGVGGLGGLWSGDVNIIGSGSDAVGTWSENSPAFSAATRRRLLAPYAAGTAGITTASSVTDILPAQFGADSAALDHAGTAIVWTGLFIPTNYTDRTLTFTPQLGSLGLLSQVYAVDANYAFGSTLPVALNVVTNFGAAVNVPIIPAPSSLALLGLGGLVMARRRR